MSEPYHFATAMLTLGVIALNSRDAAPVGKDTPSATELLLPSGGMREAATSRPAVEIYNEFDFSDASTRTSDPLILSYGERILSCEEIDFEPFVTRAEELSQIYGDFLISEYRPGKAPIQILGREWYAVPSPDLAVVHVYFR